MNPLSPSALNAERARVEAAAGVAGRNSDTGPAGGGFADMLRDLRDAPAKAVQPAPARDVPVAARAAEPGHKVPEASDPAAAATERASDEAAQAADAAEERRAAQAADDHRRTQQRGATGGRATRHAAEADDDTGPGVARRLDEPQTDGPAAGAAPTLAHWLLAANNNTASGGEAALPPPQTATADAVPDAATLTHDLIQGLRSGAARGGVGGARAAGDVREAAAAPAAGAGAARARAAQGGTDNEAGTFALPAGVKAADDARLPTPGAGIEPGHAQKLDTAALQAAAQEGAVSALPGLRRGEADRAIEDPSSAGSSAMAGLAGAPPPAPSAAESAPVQRTVDTPVGAPGFEDAVMASVATLVRDGVHEARLQLNPAELGPLAVRISVTDGAAHIDIAAAHAATRELLQAGLPALADALRADGLTLASSQVSDGAWAGGGTATGGFDQAGGGAGQRGGSPSSEGYRGNTGWPGAAPQAGPGNSPGWLPGPGRGSGRGGLDLYA
ncbi:MAG: flagellar hook-length control protein FliK [Burkholderiales bacterium]